MLLFEQEAISPDGTQTTLRVGGGSAFMTRPTETPPNAVYLPRLGQAFQYERYCWSKNATSGRTAIGTGRIDLANGDGALDEWPRYAVDGQPFTFRKGRYDNGVYPDEFPILFSGIASSITPSWGTLTINTTDALGLVLDSPLQTTKYLGTNSAGNGVEGLATDIKGNPKPKLRGFAQNIAPVPVNTSQLIYQIDDGTALLPMTLTVRVGGSVVTPGTQRASIAALQAGTPGITAYDWYAGSDGWFIKLGFVATQQVTCDVAEGTAADRTIAQIAYRVLTQEGGIPAASVLGAAALDSAQSGEVGIWMAGETTIGAFLDPLLTSGNAYLTDTADGQVQLGRLEDPEDQTSVATFWPWQLMGGPNGLSLSVSSDQGVGLRVGTVGLDNHVSNALYTNQGTAAGLPVWRVIADYAPNNTVQSVTDTPSASTAWQAIVGQPCATVVYSDPTGDIRARHLKAPEYVLQTRFRYAADALAEAARQFSLRGRQNVIVEAIVSAEDAVGVDLGDTFTLTIPRFGWDAGRKFFCIGLLYAGGSAGTAETVTLVGWGAL